MGEVTPLWECDQFRRLREASRLLDLPSPIPQEHVYGALWLLQELGSSVTLNWGEDNGLWECSWITSGKRWTSCARRMEGAIRGVIQQRIAPLPCSECGFRDCECAAALAQATGEAPKENNDAA